MKQFTIYFDRGLSDNQVFFNNLHARQGSFLHSVLFGSSFGKRVRVKNIGKKPLKIKDTSRTDKKIDPNWVAEQLGAEIIGHLTLIDGINFQDSTITLEPGVNFQPELDNLVFYKDTRKIQFKCTRVLKVINEKNEKPVWEMRR